MKRLIVLAASIALLDACATPADTPAAAPAAPTAAAQTGGPAACPQKTDILYKPEVPEAGFVPAAPRGATVVRPQRIHSADPAYPSASRRCHEEGKVTITYCISTEGRMDNVQVIVSSGYARLDNAILLWATRETHTPGTVNGRARRYCGLSLEQEFEWMEEGGTVAVIAK
jgi:periplasmic protein TonB